MKRGARRDVSPYVKMFFFQVAMLNYKKLSYIHVKMYKKMRKSSGEGLTWFPGGWRGVLPEASPCDPAGAPDPDATRPAEPPRGPPWAPSAPDPPRSGATLPGCREKIENAHRFWNKLSIMMREYLRNYFNFYYVLLSFGQPGVPPAETEGGSLVLFVGSCKQPPFISVAFAFAVHISNGFSYIFK